MNSCKGSAAVVAAMQAKRMGKSVVIVCPDKHLGGLTSGGLGWTDTGNKNTIGGISREFYHRVWQHYQKPDGWNWEAQSEFGDRNQSGPRGDDGLRFFDLTVPSCPARLRPSAY